MIFLEEVGCREYTEKIVGFRVRSFLQKPFFNPVYFGLSSVVHI